MLLFGTHGTCRSRAQSIVANQSFDAPTKRAYFGPGAYFWEYQGSSEIAEGLAALWWEFSHRTGVYDKDADKALAVVGAELLSPSDEDIVDIDDHDFQTRLHGIFKKVEGLNDEVKHQITALAIDDFAAQRAKPVLLVKTRVRPPRLLKGQTESVIQKTITTWPCFVVRAGGESLFKRIYVM